jgi:DNA-binding GntR family transcriptional regulator
LNNNITSKKPSKTLAGAVLNQLRSDIVNCKIEQGKKLRFDYLRKTYQVGISPLREALSKLTVEGLVTNEGQCGFYVAPMSLKDFEDATRLRCEIECIALRDSILLGDEYWESNIVAAFHHLMVLNPSSKEIPLSDKNINLDKWESRHRLFHQALLASCDSPRRLAMINILTDQTERYRNLAAANHSIQRKDEDEHRALMDSALARDSTKAEALLIQHYKKTLDTLKSLKLMP